MHYADLDGDFMGIFFNLRWLQWSRCPRQFSPSNIYLKNLVILDLSSNKCLKDDWEGWSQIKVSKNIFIHFIFFPFVTSFTFWKLIFCNYFLVLQMAKRLKVLNLTLPWLNQNSWLFNINSSRDIESWRVCKFGWNSPINLEAKKFESAWHFKQWPCHWQKAHKASWWNWKFREAWRDKCLID